MCGQGEATYDKVGEVPQQLRTRHARGPRVRHDGMMVNAELTEGTRLESAIERLFAEPRAAYLHLHYAAPGCYAARVERA